MRANSNEPESALFWFQSLNVARMAACYALACTLL